MPSAELLPVRVPLAHLNSLRVIYSPSLVHSLPWVALNVRISCVANKTYASFSAENSLPWTALNPRSLEFIGVLCDNFLLKIL
jgi:hypothetical protein